MSDTRQSLADLANLTGQPAPEAPAAPAAATASSDGAETAAVEAPVNNSGPAPAPMDIAGMNRKNKVGA